MGVVMRYRDILILLICILFVIAHFYISIPTSLFVFVKFLNSCLGYLCVI